jgi:hypothetical protein
MYTLACNIVLGKESTVDLQNYSKLRVDSRTTNSGVTWR